jgi:hypothetical protein
MTDNPPTTPPAIKSIASYVKRNAAKVKKAHFDAHGFRKRSGSGLQGPPHRNSHYLSDRG